MKIFYIPHTKISPKGQERTEQCGKMWNANVECREREVREAKEWGSSSERERERGKWDRKRNGTEHDSYYIFLVWALGVYHFFFFVFLLLSGLTAFGILCLIQFCYSTNTQTHWNFPIVQAASVLADWLTDCWAHIARIGREICLWKGYKMRWIYIQTHRGENMMKYGYVFHGNMNVVSVSGCGRERASGTNEWTNVWHKYNDESNTYNIRNITTFEQPLRRRWGFAITGDMTTAPLAAAAAAAGTLPFPPSISVFVERCRP